MSFSIEFVAPSKSRAVSVIRASHAPVQVLDFLVRAVEALPEANEDRKRLVRVKAVGHLAEGAGSYSISTATIEVSEIASTV